MKKITFLLTLVTFIGCVNVTRADDYDYKPYVGIGYIYSRATDQGISPYFSSVGMHIGSTYGSYFATELFYNKSNSYSKWRNEQKNKTSYQAYGLDLIGVLPVDCEKNFSFLATFGVGEYIFNQKNILQKHHNEHGYGYRFGGGVQYAWSNAWLTKLMARYVNFDQVDGYDHAMEYGLSLEYHFKE